jgi:hypothetical protein
MALLHFCNTFRKEIIIKKKKKEREEEEQESAHLISAKNPTASSFFFTFQNFQHPPFLKDTEIQILDPPSHQIWGWLKIEYNKKILE